MKIDKDCYSCAYYIEDRQDQPCCYCVDYRNWEKGEEDEESEDTE